MAYVHKLITQDEKMIGVARLHWIYVIKGLAWFSAFAFGGWLASGFIARGIMALPSDLYGLSASLMTINSTALLIAMGIGFLIFLFYVVKVIATEIGLSNRRIIHKTGLIFVKVEQIDLEEIRGENMDTGMLGRFLNYAYIDLDCRFIGDVKMDAIERPNLFIRHLHKARAETQDSLRMVMGKSNFEKPIEIVPSGGDGGQNPEIAPPKPSEPEVSPPNPPQETPPPLAPPQIDPPSPSQPPTKANHKNAGQQDVTQAVQQIVPKVAQEVIKQMSEQGLVVQTPEPESENKDVDTDLAQSFDDAVIANENDKGNNDLHNKMEHSIH